MGVLRPRLAGAVFVLSSLAWAGSVGAQYYGQNLVQYARREWRTISQDPFTVHFQAGDDSLAFRVLDLAQQTHESLAARMGHRLAHPVPILLHGSRNDLAQANVQPGRSATGTGNFAGELRNRMVVTFAGSYEGLRRLVVHQMVHAMLFDMLHGGSPVAMAARQGVYALPPWLAEGLAEFYALGSEPHAEMVVRDGTIEDYLPPLPLAGGYLAYVQGQSAIAWGVSRQGEQPLRDLLGRIRKRQDFKEAFEAAMGQSIGEFDRQWQAWLRRHWWPVVARTDSPEQFVRRLTDHRRDESSLNLSPAISPQGDRIAYLSSRRQYADVDLISAFDGKRLRRLERGPRMSAFEAVPSLRGGIAWSPDGERVALASFRGGRDVLHVRSARNGALLTTIDLPCRALAYPAWSPSGDSIAVTGIMAGRSDVWLVSVASGGFRRLTDDPWDEKELVWSPRGRRLTFASDRGAPLMLTPARTAGGFGDYGIFTLDQDSGIIETTIDTPADDHAPAWSPDGRRLAFVSLLDGTANVYLFDPAQGTRIQLSRVRGGVQALSWARDNDRLVFSAFDDGGYDLFAMREELSRDDVIERLRARVAADSNRVASMLSAATGADSGAVAADSVMARAADPVATASDSSSGAAEADSTAVLRSRADPPVAPTPGPYRPRLALDVVGGGIHAAHEFGFIGDVQFTLSDLLGNHVLYTSVDVVAETFDDVNALGVYRAMGGRWDWGGGAFHFGRFFSSRVTTLAEQFDSPRLYSERVFGGFLSLHVPFDRFRRLELNPTMMFVDREVQVDDGAGGLVSERELRSVFSPALSLVRDNAQFGRYGPVNGARTNLTYAPSFAVLEDPLEYQTVTLDTRHYRGLSRGYTLAARLLAGASTGEDPQTFRVGGYASLRGYDNFELLGTRMAIVNTEFRFPFVQELGILGPVPVGALHLRGASFIDLGFVWDKDEPVRVTEVEQGSRSLRDLKFSFGFGARTVLFFVIAKLDVAWTTNFDASSPPRWHLSLGPEF